MGGQSEGHSCHFSTQRLHSAHENMGKIQARKAKRQERWMSVGVREMDEDRIGGRYELCKSHFNLIFWVQTSF